MLTVHQLSSSLPPRSHPHLRRTLPAHLAQHHRRRSVSHPAPSDPQDGKLPVAVTLRSHAEDEDEGEDDDEDEEEMAEQAESRERLAAFVLRETSGESSEEDDDESSDDGDEDSSSSVSSSGSTPLLKPADSAVVATGKRAVTFHHSALHSPATSSLPPSSVAPVVHRKLVKPSSRQHKVSPHHYSSTHQSGNKTHPVRLHRRKPYAAESVVHPVPDDTQHSVPCSPAVTECIEVATPVAAIGVAERATRAKGAALIPASSVTRYALLVAILRRSDGRDKLIRTAYFGSNHLRALAHVIHSRLSHNKRLLPLLSISSSSTSPVLFRLLAAASSFCQGADTHLGRLSEVLGAARQLLRFGRWVYDLQSLSEAWQEWKRCCSIEDKEVGGTERRVEQATAMLELINAFLGVLIDLMDDVEWLAEHRVLPASLSSPAGLASAVLWFASVCIDIPFTLHTLSALPSSRGHNTERRAEQLSLLRYTGDLLYSGSLVAEHAGWMGDSGDETRWRVGDTGGLVSALVSLYKLSRSETLHRSVH